ncbi:glycosyltransferase [Paludisphaera rhizosphaerae]|uniref:glycosyltransferase n=1 Tax=Paludisphaera rhizosphaerae TaxID=2711216 RepID=UPI0013EABF2A|nr:glycosyltransferase [Paludisphaera rhizosphaerae]
MLRRLLFASVHGYVDPSSGAACATRDALELLASRGVECRVASTGILSYDRARPVEPLLEAAGVASASDPGAGGPLGIWSFDLGGVAVRMVRTRSSRLQDGLDEAEGRALVRLVELELERFRPQALLTYGGHPANLALMRAARRRGVPVAFHLHNFAYNDRADFAAASAVVTPSEYARRRYARTLGIESTAIPSTIVNERLLVSDRDPRSIVFANPQPAKGAAVLARIAAELDVRRPDIPLLVFEGRGDPKDLEAVAPGLAQLRNLHARPGVADPRDVHREARIVLMPSLVRETFGRVAAEALVNGIPVLASDRGALPETLGDAGFVFTLPAECRPDGGRPPTVRDVAPWVAAIEKIWDDPAFEGRHRALAIREAARWTPDVVAARWLDFFGAVALGG